jgi:uncharacterized protein (TIGR00251 family)
MTALPWRATSDGLELTVRLTPRGGADRIEGVGEAEGRPCLRVRVAAAPVEGAANAALIALLARTFGLPRTAVRFVAGENARLKRLHLRGAAPEPLAALLETK